MLFLLVVEEKKSSRFFKNPFKKKHKMKKEEKESMSYLPKVEKSLLYGTPIEQLCSDGETLGEPIMVSYFPRIPFQLQISLSLSTSLSGSLLLSLSFSLLLPFFFSPAITLSLSFFLSFSPQRLCCYEKTVSISFN